MTWSKSWCSFHIKQMIFWNICPNIDSSSASISFCNYSLLFELCFIEVILVFAERQMRNGIDKCQIALILSSNMGGIQFQRMIYVCVCVCVGERESVHAWVCVCV